MDTNDYVYEISGKDNDPHWTNMEGQINNACYYYTGNDDIIFSFENIDEEVDSICLIYVYPGTYNLDSIKVFSRIIRWTEYHRQ